MNKTKQEGIPKVFRVVAVDAQLFMTTFEAVGGQLRISGGLFGSIFNIIQENLGFEYNLTLLNGYRYGSFRNGTWDGMIGHLARNETDMTVSELSVTVDRYPLLDFGSSFVTLGRKIFIRRNVQQGLIDWSFFAAPFSKDLHIISFLFIVFIFGFTLWGSQTLVLISLHKQFRSFTYTGTRTSLAEGIWTGFCCYTQKGSEIIPSGQTCRTVFLLFYIASLLIFTAYSATLISHLSTAPAIDIPFRDLQDFVDNSKGWIGGPIKGDLTQLYMEKVCPGLLKLGPNAQCELLVGLWEKVVKAQKDRLPTSFKEGVDLVKKEKFAFIAVGLGTRDYIDKNLEEKDACNIYEMEGDYVTSNLAFGYRKGFPYRDEMNDNILRLRSSGIISILQRRWFPQKKQCDTMTSLIKQIDFGDIATLPLLWGIGSIFSLLVLVVEMIYSRSIVVVRTSSHTSIISSSTSTFE